MRFVKTIPLLLLITALFIPQGAVRSDAAPPVNPPGGDISPEGSTQVQMVAEQVVMDFRAFTDNSAKVTAWFQFKNTGTADEHIKVRFPMNGDPALDNQGKIYYPLIQDFTAWLGGQRLPTQVAMDNDPNAAQFFFGESPGTILYWSVFDMDFPVGSNVKLTVSYTFRPSVDANNAEANYILATGAGWKGPIGTADVILRFPYIVNNYNFALAYYTAPGAQSSGTTVSVVENEIRLHWDDLEPTLNNNVNLWFLQPQLWEAVLNDRAKVIADPDSEEAWLALARAYIAAAQEHHGLNEDLTSFYIRAMESAIKFEPNNASLHAEFAKALEWWGYFSEPAIPESEYFHEVALNELATALKLDPNNADAMSFLQDLRSNDPSFTLPTPGPFPTYNPTMEPEPTDTPIPSPTLTLSRLDTPTNIPAATTLAPSLAALTPLPTLATTPHSQSDTMNIISLPWFILAALAAFSGGLFAGFLIKHKK